MEPTTTSHSTSSLELTGATSIPVPRIEMRVQRLVRNSATAQRVKVLHNFICQICGTGLTTIAGPYAEGVHIRPLGKPHNGPDTEENLLCLCPNDHVRFDYGELYITNDLRVIARSSGILGTLRITQNHTLNLNHLAYHRELYWLIRVWLAPTRSASERAGRA